MQYTWLPSASMYLLLYMVKYSYVLPVSDKVVFGIRAVIWAVYVYATLGVCYLRHCRDDPGSVPLFGATYGYAHRDYVVFFFHWEYFGTCAIVRATDGDAHTGILLCLLLFMGVFWNLFHYSSCT